MPKKKQLYYEILPPDDPNDISNSDTPIAADCFPEAAGDVTSVVAERDYHAELIAAAKRSPRLRMRVKPDHRADEVGISMFLAAVVFAGLILMKISKSRTGIILVAIIMIAAVVGAISALIYFGIKRREKYYCYYLADERGTFCMSVIEDSAVVFACGVAYVIKKDRFYTLDADGFSTWLDGECCGIFSILNSAPSDVECEDSSSGEHCYFVKNRFGGGHRVFLTDNGKIDAIISEQPYYSDVTDGKTGERKIKTRVYEKTEPTENFAWEIPEFVRKAFDDNGVAFPDMPH